MYKVLLKKCQTEQIVLFGYLKAYSAHRASNFLLRESILVYPPMQAITEHRLVRVLFQFQDIVIDIAPYCLRIQSSMIYAFQHFNEVVDGSPHLKQHATLFSPNDMCFRFNLFHHYLESRWMSFFRTPHSHTHQHSYSSYIS